MNLCRIWSISEIWRVGEHNGCLSLCRKTMNILRPRMQKGNKQCPNPFHIWYNFIINGFIVEIWSCSIKSIKGETAPPPPSFWEFYLFIYFLIIYLLFVYVFSVLSTYLFIYLFDHLSIYLFICLIIYLFIYLFICSNIQFLIDLPISFVFNVYQSTEIKIEL